MKNKTVYHFRLLVFLLLFLSPVATHSLSIDHTEIGTSIFSTLAGIQASIFAIVFSVVILGVQLSTSQYSPRLPDLFRSDKDYLRTVGLFATSIGISLLGILLYGYAGNFWQELWMYFSSILAIVAFASLFNFVDRTLEQTTPEGILNRLDDGLTPSRIIEQAEASSNNHSETDPFVVPFSVINSQITERDTAAVYFGLDIITRRVGELFKEYPQENFNQDSPVGDSLNQLCTNRLKNTSQRAVSADLEEGANKTVDTLEAIGKTSVDKSFHQPVLYAGRGLSDLVYELEYSGINERVRGKAIESSKNIIQNAAESGGWEETGKATRYLGWQMTNSVYARNETQNNDTRYTSAILNYFPSILGELVDSTADTVDDERVNWHSTHPVGNLDSYSEAKAIQAVYISVSELIGSLLQFELRTGVNFCNWGDIGFGLMQSVAKLSDNGLDSLRKLWIATILYLEFVERETSDDIMKGFDPKLYREVSNNEITAVIESITAEEIDPTQWLHFRQTIDPTEIPRTGYQYQLNIDTEESFEDWLSRQNKY